MKLDQIVVINILNGVISKYPNLPVSQIVTLTDEESFINSLINITPEEYRFEVLQCYFYDCNNSREFANYLVELGVIEEKWLEEAEDAIWMNQREYVIKTLKNYSGRIGSLYQILHFKEEELFISFMLDILKPLGRSIEFLECYYTYDYSVKDMIWWLQTETKAITKAEFDMIPISLTLSEELQEFVDNYPL